MTSAVRCLYKRILELHRLLPPRLRALGDQYVREEFRRHRGASDQELRTFVREWQSYKEALQTQVLEASGDGPVPGRLGVDLPEEKLSDFQEEQIGQLYELMLESTKPSPQVNVHEDGAKK